MSTRKRRKHSDSDKEVGDNSDDEECGDSDDDVESVDSEHENINKEVNIDFSAYPPCDDDFDGIKNLLSQMWPKESLSVNELSKLLITHKTICTLIKQDCDEEDDDEEDDDDNVFGITSVIAVSDNENDKCVNEMKSILLSKMTKESEIYKLMTNCWDKIAIIVNERLVNLPPKISLHCYQQLMSDINAEREKNSDRLKFEWFVMVCRIVKSKGSDGSKSETIYVYPEDEIFDEKAHLSHDFSVAQQRDGNVFSGDWNDDECLGEPFRKILVISEQNFVKAIDELKTEFK